MKNYLMSLVTLISLIFIISSCSSDNKAADDKYVGNWKEISGGSESLTVKKLHDYEYQIGSLTAYSKVANGQDYLEAEMSSVFVQFIYDNTTSHLIVRSPVHQTEYEKVD